VNLELIAVGAANVDLVAEVERLPGADEEVRIKNMRIEPGGSAANVAVGVGRLGHRAGFLGQVGEDQFGQLLLESFKEEGVDTSHILRHGPAGLVVAIVHRGLRSLYTYGGGAREFGPEHIPEDYIRGAKLLHLASIDSPRGAEALARAAEIAKEAGIRMIFDPGHLAIDWGLEVLTPILENTYVLLPSESEVERLLGSPAEAPKLLDYGPKIIVVTQGARGCLLITEEGMEEVPAHELKGIVDPVGAGDAFAAGFIAALLEGKDLKEACRFANYVAARSLERPGARSIPRRAELDH
jgi:sugar/nucleoside kinase (ribokinase family)